MEDFELIDHAEQSQYEFHIDSYIPKIEYIKTANGEIALTHTEVPEALEGRGVGSQLVKKVLEDIDRQHLKVIPLCPFVAAYIRKHPEWKRLVMAGVNV